MKDTYQTINCPACGTPMKKVFLENQQFLVDVCLDGCGGIWLDNREMLKVDEKSEDITELQKAFEGKEFKKIDRDADRNCPLCGKKMVKNSVSAKLEINIDECYFCGGKFFDYNELEQMRNQYDEDEQRIADIKKISSDSVRMKLMLDRLMEKDNLI